MIYGEESVDVKFNNGLWRGNAVPAPNGYVRDMVNLILNKKGNPQKRGSFLNNYAYTTVPSSGNSFGSTTSGYKPLYPFGEGTTISKLTNYCGGAVPNELAIYTLQPQSLAVQAQTNGTYTNASYAPLDANAYSCTVQYRDRLYAVLSGTGVVKITGWNFQTSAATTVTPIAGSPNAVGKLIFHKDRLFLITGTRVYFTDAITVGGYPETWNTASNFFDLPTATAGTILDCYVMNHLIYIFNHIGVFTVQTVGPPAQWIIKNVAPTLSAQGFNSVAQNDGVFYIYDGTCITAFTGFSSRRISYPMEELMAQYDGIGLFEFENGFLMSCVEYVVVGSAYAVRSARMFYYDGELDFWSEFTFSTYAAYEIGTCPVGTWQCLPVASKRNVLIAGIPTTVSAVDFALVKSGQSGIQCANVYNYVLYNNNAYTETGVAWSLTVDHHVVAPHRGNYIIAHHKAKRLKMAYLDFYCTTNDNITIKTGIEGATPGSPVVITPNTAIADNNEFAKIPMPQYCRRVRINISGTNAASSSKMPLEIKDLILIFDTGRDEPDNALG